MLKTILLILFLSGQFAFAAKTEVLQLEQGAIQGHTHCSGVESYLGIPFAAPPIGPLRWKAPQPPTPWEGIFDARQTGAQCLQPQTLGQNPKIIGSEDCLTLNVWSPQHPSESSELVPVMVFIHGGFFLQGDKAEIHYGIDLYNGEELSKRGSLVVVTINYRLGVMGFMGHPDLSAESEQNTSGNYGIYDQIAALQWIKNNISVFGGDPNRVTIFGESAGAASTLVLLASPLAQGLFQGAIVQSGYLTQTTLPSVEEIGNQVADKTGCTSAKNVLECLRAQTSQTIAQAVPSQQTEGEAAPLTPNVDGILLPSPVLEIFQKGIQNQVPILIGTNANESATLVQSLYGNPVQNDQELASRVISFSGEDFWNSVQNFYTSSVYGSAQQALIQLSSDVIFTCPARQLLRAHTDRSSMPAWRYVFSHVNSSLLLRSLQAGHALELPYVFHHTPRIPFIGFSNDENTLSLDIQDRWIQFAKNQSPGDDWPAFENQNESYLELESGFPLGSQFRNASCDALDRAILLNKK